MDMSYKYASFDINWWTWVVWVIVMFYQPLDSFWRHPFTADDPVVRQWCNATFLQISNEEILVNY